MPSQKRLRLRQVGKHHGSPTWWVRKFNVGPRLARAFEMNTDPRHLAGVHPRCPRCNHDCHEGVQCNFPITAEIRDDIGIFAPPSGITRTMLIAVCDCKGVFTDGSP